MRPQEHWQRIYTRKAETEVSWYQPHARQSVELLQAAGARPELALLDVGGGASTLVDDLWRGGWRDLTVLDIAESALQVARERLLHSDQPAAASAIHWLCADITDTQLPAQRYDIWHDRAVFHFLTDDPQRQRYLAQVARAVRPGGLVLVATFAKDGPEQCSGLPVCRYDAQQLHDTFGEAYQLLDHRQHTHVTPWGSEQHFTWCLCRHP